MNKTILAIVIAIVVVVIGYFFLRGAYQPTQVVPQASNQQTPPQLLTSEPSTQQPINQPSITQTPAVQENLVNYTDSGYSPATLKITNGETVIFKNQSSQSMWTASAVHPAHQGYPTTGGCIGSTFDACKGIQPGGNWSFRFEIVGTWRYHDHLNPGNTGTIVVE